MNLSRPGRTLTALFGTVFIALHVSSTFAENGTTNQEPTTIAHELTGTNSIPLTKVPSVVLKGLGRQDVFDQVTDSLLKRIFDSKETTNAFLEFISDWHVRPKVFQATGSTNDATFGVEFNYNKSLASHVLNPNSKNPAGLALTLSAKG